ncbi:MAG: phosphoglycerate kinase [Pseudomonadota bacterium]
MTSFKTLDDLQVAGRRVLLRADLNVPMKDGRVTDQTRITRLAPTIRDLAERGARVVILSHFGRPKVKADPEMSLQPLIGPLSETLGRPVAFAADCIGPSAEQATAALADGEVLLLENLRFHGGEEANDPDFAAALANLGELYVNDAFSVSHRAHASVEALAHLLPAAAGRLMAEELEHLSGALERPERPVAAIVGGAKVSTKLDLLGNLVSKVELLAIGGGMANTFLYAMGHSVGGSLCERDMAETARAVLKEALARSCEVVLPSDVVIAGALEANAPSQVVPVDQVPDGQLILDVGPQSAAALAKRLETCRTLVWNGPLGCFELPPFEAGTFTVLRAAAQLTKDGKLLSVAGGGDTVAALSQAGVAEDFSYLSTAGGAFLEWLEGKTLPGVAVLSS